MTSEEEKIGMYIKLLQQLPPITHQTIKKLMSHLHFIQTQASKNQMTVKNLATVWGPTLMHAEVCKTFKRKISLQKRCAMSFARRKQFPKNRGVPEE